ncbi:MAG: serine hydrolase domain-containing protein [Flavobacteriales bacterium]
MKAFCLLLLIVSSFVTNAQDNDLTTRMDAYMQAMNEQGLSASVICMKDGKRVLKKAYGFSDREKQILNTPQTVFTVGSITKQFTAAAIMKLEMQGKLKTTDLMSRYISDVPADKKDITLHQLLTMNAGLVEAFGDDYEALNRDAFLKRAMESTLVSPPGTEYLYSNVNYSILGSIVELVSGKDYETYCRENLWLPAGMNFTGYVLPDWSKMNISVGYNKQDENTGTSLAKNWDKDGPYWNLKCNGGVLSTCDDMYRWYLALQGETVLSAAAKTKMYTPHIAEGPEGQSHYGYGWAIFKTMRNTRLITHNGGNGIFFADYLNYEDENTFVFLQSNASKRGQQDVAWELGRMMLIPGYEPEIKSYNPKPTTVDEVEKQFNTKTISALIGFATGKYTGTTETFVQDNLGPGLLQSMPLAEHTGMFDMLKKDLTGATFLELLQAGNEIEFHFTMPDGQTMQVITELNMEGKIRGLRFGE